MLEFSDFLAGSRLVPYSGVLSTPTTSSLESHFSLTQLTAKRLVDADFQHTPTTGASYF